MGAIVVIAVMALTFGQWRNVITLNKPFGRQQSTVNSQQSTVKILTFNTHIFNNHRDDSFEKIAEFIKESDADIVCLQEFGHYHRYGTSKKDILKFFDSIYPYRHIWFKNQNKWGENGLATFSRYPIVKKKKIEYKSADNISIYSDIVIDGDTIRLINNHLESNKLNKEDRKFAEKLIDESKKQEILDAGLKIGSRLVTGAKNRMQQASAVRQTIEETNYPTIALGDFNDVPLSYTYNCIVRGLNDTFSEKAEGFAYTYNTKYKLLRIDNILVSPAVEVVSYEVDNKVDYSDHYPVISRVKLNKK